MAVLRRLKADDAAAEQSFEHFVLIRTDREALGVRPGNVPERENRRARKATPQHSRHEREVIVLHEHDRIVAAGFGGHRVREALIDALVLQPVAAAEDRMRVRQMAERPQRFVREAVVVAVSSCSVSQTRRSRYERLPLRPRGDRASPTIRDRPIRCRARPTRPSTRA